VPPQGEAYRARQAVRLRRSRRLLGIRIVRGQTAGCVLRPRRIAFGALPDASRALACQACVGHRIESEPAQGNTGRAAAGHTSAALRELLPDPITNADRCRRDAAQPTPRIVPTHHPSRHGTRLSAATRGGLEMVTRKDEGRREVVTAAGARKSRPRRGQLQLRSSALETRDQQLYPRCKCCAVRSGSGSGDDSNVGCAHTEDALSTLGGAVSSGSPVG